MGHVPFSFSQKASAQMRCADTRDPCDTRQWTHHPTVRELLLNNPTLFSQRSSHTVSITSHSNRRPAISSSELEMVFICVLCKECSKD
jgi:hypothetical protein